MAAEIRKHKIAVTYTKRDELHSTVSTNAERTPMELASSALMSFFDSLYPFDRSIPESVTVDGQTFTVDEIRAWERERYERIRKERD